jgi:hypothetical protein
MHSHANRRLKTARATVPGADRAPKPSTAAEPGLQTPNSSQSTAHNTIQAAAIEPMPVASLRPLMRLGSKASYLIWTGVKPLDDDRDAVVVAVTEPIERHSPPPSKHAGL